MYCDLWKNERRISGVYTPNFSVKLVIVSRERARVSKQVNEKEPPRSSKLWVGNRSAYLCCFTLGVSFRRSRLNGNSRPNTRIKTVKAFPLGGLTPLLP